MRPVQRSGQQQYRVDPQYFKNLPHWKIPFSGKLIDVTDECKDRLQVLMNSTIASHGHGNEFGTIGGKDPKAFQVVKVDRLQDPILWGNYCTRREVIRIKMANTNELKYISKNRIITECLDETVNEYLLFHGTDSETIELILQSGFDERYSSVNGMFGPGIYFAENSSKSNQYVSCPKCISGSIPKKKQM